MGTLRAPLLSPTEALKKLAKLPESISPELWKMVKGSQQLRECFINTKATATWCTGSQWGPWFWRERVGPILWEVWLSVQWLWRCPHQRLGFISHKLLKLFQGREAATQRVFVKWTHCCLGQGYQLWQREDIPKYWGQKAGEWNAWRNKPFRLPQVTGSPEDATHAHKGPVLRKDLRRPWALTTGYTSSSGGQEVKVKVKAEL